MDRNRWIIFAVLCVAILGGLIFFNRSEKVDVSNINGAEVIKETADGKFADNTYGNPDSKVVLIEYGDFQCPGCRTAASALDKLKEDYKQDIAFVYRHFPLVTIHPNALASAAASEAANNQGKFWEMLTILFERQNEWSGASSGERTEIFKNYAQELGLNIEQYDTDIASKETSDKINFQRSLAGEMGVNSTPTFFLNGEKLPTDVTGNDAQDLRKRIDEILDRQ